jgi:mRNA interferase RelE/StbE
MRTFTIRFTKSATKEFNKLSTSIQDRILQALDLLAKNPFSELLKIKRLKGVDALFRFRIGDCRVVYEVHKNVIMVLVIRIGHRKDVYR